jgi:outer membrane lipoprotein-sorting protein
MKSIALVLVLMLGHSGPKQSPSANSPQAGGDLQAVLSEMDKSAALFKTAQANFEWDNYQKVVDETTKQNGIVYFRRSGNDIEAMFKITSPAPKEILYKHGILQLYEQKIDRITEHKAENQSDVEAFLSLGFGARGHDLLKSYDVKMTGWETLDNVKTARLELVAKSEKVRNMFPKFVMWIDAARDVPLKLQVFAQAGDYWTSHYTDIKLSAKLPDSDFHLDTTAKTKKVTQ